MATDKDWATKHLLDPLTEPDPSDETGLNSHFGSTYAPRQSYPSPPSSATLKDSSAVEVRSQNTGSSTNPFRRGTGSQTNSPTFPHSKNTSNDYPSPPSSASPRREKHSSHRAEAFGAYKGGRPRRSSQPTSSTPKAPEANSIVRGNSLRERYPGDQSHRPLEMIKKDVKLAHRSPHLRKKHMPGADTIDRLDMVGGNYHHEGPYDAALLARNTSWESSPIAAVSASNDEALKATPRENIIDALERHRPLEGVANIPPGMPDKFGRILDYEEGADLQREAGGDYRRWPGVEYLPGDLKGKGEPSYTIEKALKEHKIHSDDGIEMKARSRNKSLSHADNPHAMSTGQEGASGDRGYDDSEGGVGRSNTTGKKVTEGFKKRIGSLRRRKE
ncbi:hypothetical protein AOQ84DRAFT_378513 [Glonium stellatum]|uniref:Pal1 cell morphology n=1 Tax=Glonium stellatum TaxID=574774 RepID=A0A8E2EY88_9PEZI|nr:hypothetical protein AOQ84DRAFT_378513 [Glonium stellatum]